ncbi:MAG: helix-turn-helix domain-containing protein [Phycisphaerae bacterium]|nr:helix-turn-helix domain-containing protein [Phycisphaerae bacterium]
MSDKQNIVKSTCQELGITQKELAERLGVTTSAISQWNTDVPKMAQIALELLIENHRLNKDIQDILKGHKAINRLLEKDK